MNELKQIKSAFVELSFLKQNRTISKNKIRKKCLKSKTKLESIENLDFNTIQYNEKGTIEYQIMTELKKDMWSRNLNLLYDSLNQFENFVLFTKYYSISDTSIKQIASIAKLKQLNKNEVLFQIGDESDAFFIIICGRIIIKDQKIEANDLLNGKIVLSTGHCFGDIGLLYSLPRTQACIAEEDTILLYITKDNFNKILKKQMLKSEMDRKMVVARVLPSVKHISQKKFLSFYRYFVFRTYKKNDIVYKQGDIADSLYIIQHGKCSIIKNNRHILIIGQNDFVGLEAIDNDSCIKTNSDIKIKRELIKYGYSVICHENSTILQVKLSSLGDHFYQIKSYINQLKNSKENIISKYYKMSEQCSFHKYQYLSYLNKKSKNLSNDVDDHNMNNKIDEKIIKDIFQLSKKMNSSHNIVIMNKCHMKSNIIKQGISKSNHQRCFSDLIINTNKTPKSNIANLFKSISNKNKSRNNKKKLILLDKLYGNTNDYKPNLSKNNNDNNIINYKFNTGSYTLPFVSL